MTTRDPLRLSDPADYPSAIPTLTPPPRPRRFITALIEALTVVALLLGITLMTAALYYGVRARNAAVTAVTAVEEAFGDADLTPPLEPLNDGMTSVEFCEDVPPAGVWVGSPLDGECVYD